MTGTITSSPVSKPSWRPTALAALLAMWLGGIAIYAVIVVPAGAAALGSHEAFGFVTRRVTVGFNWIGSGILGLLLLDLLVKFRPASRVLWVTFAIMSLCQIALWALHPWLDALLDPVHRHVVDREAFYGRHRIYLLVTTLQWIAGVFCFRELWTRR